MACVRPNHPDVIDYANQLGTSTMVVAGVIGAWQDENNTTDFPDYDVVHTIWANQADVPFIEDDETDTIEKNYPSWVSDNDLLILQKAEQSGLIDLSCN